MCTIVGAGVWIAVAVGAVAFGAMGVGAGGAAIAEATLVSTIAGFSVGLGAGATIGAGVVISVVEVGTSAAWSAFGVAEPGPLRNMKKAANPPIKTVKQPKATSNNGDGDCAGFGRVRAADIVVDSGA